MPSQTIGRLTGEYIVTEAGGTRARETVTLLSGENLKAGAVLGKVTHAAATPTADAGNTGDGTCGAVTVGVDAKVGTYRLTFIEPDTDLGTFQVEDPDGINVGSGVVGAAFTGGGLTFTVADGATDFVSGDAFDIVVAAGSGKYVEHDPAGTDGSEHAVAILYDNVDASGGDQSVVVTARDTEVDGNALEWITGISAQNKADGIANLATVGIIVR